MKRYFITAGFEGNDREFYEALAEDHADLGIWTVGDGGAECDLGEMTLDAFVDLVASFGDEIGDLERAELVRLGIGDITTLERGRGAWYDIICVIDRSVAA